MTKATFLSVYIFYCQLWNRNSTPLFYFTLESIWSCEFSRVNTAAIFWAGGALSGKNVQISYMGLGVNFSLRSRSMIRFIQFNGFVDSLLVLPWSRRSLIDPSGFLRAIATQCPKMDLSNSVKRSMSLVDIECVHTPGPSIQQHYQLLFWLTRWHAKWLFPSNNVSVSVIIEVNDCSSFFADIGCCTDHYRWCNSRAVRTVLRLPWKWIPISTHAFHCRWSHHFPCCILWMLWSYSRECLHDVDCKSFFADPIHPVY